MNEGTSQDERYFNFPVQMMEGMITDKDEVLNNILYYSLVAHSEKLEHGTPQEKFKAACKYFGVQIGNQSHAIKVGTSLFDSLPVNSPKTGLNKKIFWDFHDQHKEPFDIACLLAFLSLRSGIGYKPLWKGTNNYLWARMDGKLNSINDISELSPEIQKYANEYQTRKIINELRLNWGLVYYSRYTRGFYVSFKLTLEELIYQSELKRQSTKIKEMKMQESEALKKAIARIHTEGEHDHVTTITRAIIRDF